MLCSPSASHLDRGRHLEAAFRSPATKTRFRAPIARSSLPAYLFNIHRTFTESAPVRCSGPPRRPPLPFRVFLCPSRSMCSADLALRRPTFASRPIPFAPRSHSINERRPRINVPGSLRLARSDASVISWNQDHHALSSRDSQTNYYDLLTFSSGESGR